MESIAMVVDDSVIKKILEGDNSGKAEDLLKLFKKIELDPRAKEKIWIVTPCSSFLRAIYFSDPAKFKFENLQKLISCMSIAPSFADFRNKDDVMREIIALAKVASGEE